MPEFFPRYLFVKQSLLLWREIMDNLYQLWHLTEADLLDSDKGYRLVDTGQGLNRPRRTTAGRAAS